VVSETCEAVDERGLLQPHKLDPSCLVEPSCLTEQEGHKRRERQADREDEPRKEQ
jgi:hypothetical protein